MNKLLSKIATFLLASVILSASCLSCLLQATPAYAASSTITEIGTNQGQDCGDYQKPVEKVATAIDAHLSVAVKTNITPFPDRSVHMRHGTDCGSTYSQANSGIKRLQPTESHFAMSGSAFIFHTDTVYDQWSLAPPRVLPRNTILLTGTTIKKE